MVIGTLRRDDGGSTASSPRSGSSIRSASTSIGRGLDRRPRRRAADVSVRAQRFWLDAPATAATSVPRASSRPVTRCSGRRSRWQATAGCLLTGRLSLGTHPWLTDHAVDGAAAAARHRLRRAGPARRAAHRRAAIDELTLEAPLLLPDDSSAQVQVTVGADDETEQHPFSVYRGHRRRVDTATHTARWRPLWTRWSCRVYGPHRTRPRSMWTTCTTGWQSRAMTTAPRSAVCAGRGGRVT